MTAAQNGSACRGDRWRQMSEEMLRARVRPYYWLIPAGFGSGLVVGGNLANHVVTSSDEAGGAAIVAACFAGVLLGVLTVFAAAPVREYWRRYGAGELKSQIAANAAAHRNSPVVLAESPHLGRLES
jgi:hypothetical protein